MHELIVVPVLFQHFLRPNGRPSKHFSELVGATFAHESTEVDDGVRRLGHFAVQAPLVVGILQELLQIRGQLWVQWQFT